MARKLIEMTGAQIIMQELLGRHAQRVTQPDKYAPDDDPRFGFRLDKVSAEGFGEAILEAAAKGDCVDVRIDDQGLGDENDPPTGWIYSVGLIVDDSKE
jgi:hypothetical protein